MIKGLLLYICSCLLILQHDYNRYQRAKDQVSVRIWICSKTRPIGMIQSKMWNQTLFSLPGIKTFPYKSVKPIEKFFDWTDRIVLPYSIEAASMNLYEGWYASDNLCLFVDEIPFICNIFDGCKFWPLVIPLKLVAFVISETHL